MIVAICLLLLEGFLLASADDPLLTNEEEPSVEYLISASMDVLQHTHLELWKLYLERQNLRGNAPYEIGFLIRTAEERYRKMVDFYNTSITMDNALRARDHIMHLQKIEKLHWDVMHISNMLHEVERKYKIKPQQLDKRVFWPFGVKPNTTTTMASKGHKGLRVTRSRLQQRRAMGNMSIETDDHHFDQPP